MEKASSNIAQSPLKLGQSTLSQDSTSMNKNVLRLVSASPVRNGCDPCVPCLSQGEGVHTDGTA